MFGKPVNRGAVYRLKIPRKYIFYGHQKATDCMKKAIEHGADFKSYEKCFRPGWEKIGTDVEHHIPFLSALLQV